eukprot:m.305189 g.305189  ORF g.305189 m.305189 type:complete len:64 (-) comp20176_c0_seq27:1258-1449(-)
MYAKRGWRRRILIGRRPLWASPTAIGPTARADAVRADGTGLDDPRHAAAFVAMVETVLMALQP